MTTPHERLREAADFLARESNGLHREAARLKDDGDPDSAETEVRACHCELAANTLRALASAQSEKVADLEHLIRVRESDNIELRKRINTLESGLAAQEAKVKELTFQRDMAHMTLSQMKEDLATAKADALTLAGEVRRMADRATQAADSYPTDTVDVYLMGRANAWQGVKGVLTNDRPAAVTAALAKYTGAGSERSGM